MAVNGGHGAHPRLTKTNWCEGFAASFQGFFGSPLVIRETRCGCIQGHCTRLTKTNVIWVSWGGAAGGRGQPVLGIRGNAKRWAEKLCTGSHGTGCHSSRSRAVARGGGSPRGCACSSSAFRTGQARSHDRETRTCRRSPGIDDSANCAPANAFAETCNRPIAEEAPRTRRRTAERLAAKSQCRPRRLGEEVGDRLIPLAHPRIRSRKK
ncbi:hypothetical protein IMCGPPIG_04342 [Stenotrophomonas maltophilia]|nr:hypothetical protein PLCFDHLH_04332 [Stenotrophomonas maltophilia]QNG93069.1 hypothetical protein IMCGPPIG_04342 [Stenotrophomonas maltophilia]